MSKVTLKAEALKVLYGVMNSSAMRKESILLNISDNKLVLMDYNESNTVIMGYQTSVISSDEDFELPIFLKDLKSVIDLSKNADIELTKTPGKTICKIGKIKKTIPQPNSAVRADKKFKINYPLKMTLTAEDVDSITKSFADSEESDVYIVTTGSMINISSNEGARRSELEFSENDMENTIIEEDITARYDASLFIPVLKSFPTEGGATIEAATNKPVKISADRENTILRAYIAPRVIENI
jgi:hypothetical protein